MPAMEKSELYPKETFTINSERGPSQIRLCGWQSLQQLSQPHHVITVPGTLSHLASSALVPSPEPGPVSGLSPTYVVFHVQSLSLADMSHAGSGTGMSKAILNCAHIPSHISCLDSYPAAVELTT